MPSINDIDWCRPYTRCAWAGGTFNNTVIDVTSLLHLWSCCINQNISAKRTQPYRTDGQTDTLIWCGLGNQLKLVPPVLGQLPAGRWHTRTAINLSSHLSHNNSTVIDVICVCGVVTSITILVLHECNRIGQTDGQTDSPIHSLRVGWRNLFSCCAVVSVFCSGGK
jgi:hypothetical protein